MNKAAVSNDGRNLWAEAAIAFHANSDAKIACRLNRTSQQIGKFRREGKYPTEKFISECNKALCLTTLPSSMRGGWLYAAIRNYIVEYSFAEKCGTTIKKMLEQLDELIPNAGDMEGYLQHLKATIWIISRHPDGHYLRLKNAQTIHEALQQNADDPYLKAVSLSQLTNIKYMLCKYHSGETKQLTQAHAQSLLSDSYEVAFVLNNLITSTNLVEVASVAEDKEKLRFAYEKIMAQVNSKYLANAVTHHLTTRDGVEFRLNNPLQLK